MSVPQQQSPPRALAQTTGLLFQFSGSLMSLSACCWWAFAGYGSEVARPVDPNRAIVDIFRDATAAQWWGMIAISTSLVGGLGLLAVGIGLQHDMLPKGRAAKGLTGAMALLFWAHVLCAAVWFPSISRIATVAVIGILWSALFLLAGAAAEELRRNPAPMRDSSWTRRDEDDLRNAASPRPRDETSR